jgi:hypothetical protein
MKRSFYKTVALIIILIAIIGISGSFYVRAQDETGPGDEPVQPTGEVAPPRDLTGSVSPAVIATGKWYIIAGAIFLPSSNTMTWTYGGAGCLNPSSTGTWRASVNLPDGAILKSLWVGFYNTAPSLPSHGYLYSYRFDGTYVEIADVTTRSGAVVTGYQWDYFNFTGVPVDNFDNSYAFVWGGSTTQQLCYMMVNYTPPPFFGAALPLTVKQP